MLWMRHEGPDGLIFTCDRIRTGWSRVRQTYWVELLDENGEDVIDSVNVGATTQAWTDEYDVADAASVWADSREDSEIDMWTDNVVMMQQLAQARAT